MEFFLKIGASALAVLAFGAATNLVAQTLPSLPTQPSPSDSATPEAAAAEKAPLPPSSLARRLYESQRDKLVQVRVLVAGTESQASSGSGFFATPEGLLITNYHVVSQLVLEPDRYRAEFVRTDNLRGPISVLAIDIQHDLAVVKPGIASPATGWSVVTLAPDDSLTQGDKVFSLGNPLDLGFAISEGTYNGRPERSLYPHLLFTGAMNPGVSGGPAMDEQGRVVGVNVAGYGRAAELTNFQVPVKFVRELLSKARTRPAASAADLRTDMRNQLIAHQTLMLDGMQSKSWKTQPLGAYRIPIIPETLARCWGEASDSEKKNYRYETARCTLSSSLYIDNTLRIGSVSTQHEYSTSDTLSALRLASLRSKSLANEQYNASAQSKARTAARCTENFVKSQVPVRAVTCVRAYKKFEGLYDITTIVVSMDANNEGLESVLALNGVEHERGLRESQQFVQAIARAEKKKP